MEAFLLKAGLWLGDKFLDFIQALSLLFPSVVGSSLSLFMGAEKMQQLSNLSKVFTFIFGVILGHEIGGAIIEHWGIKPTSLIASTIQISVGFMGMAALAEAKIQIPIAITALRKKWFGE